MDLALTREDILEKLLENYAPYFDVDRIEENFPDVPLAATCRFYVHSEKYVLVKKAKLWEADCNEYVYIFSLPELTGNLFTSCKDYAYREGMKLIDPKPGHMYSYITAVFICERCTPEGERALKKCNIYKSFHFSWYGWMNFHATAVVREENRIFSNRMGRDNTKVMKKILNQEKQRG